MYIRSSEAKRENTTAEPKHSNAWKMIRNKVWYTTELSFLSASSASRPWKDLTWTNIQKLRWQSFGFFWPPSPLCWQFLPYESWHFWTTYPPLLVNVVCERPLTAYTHIIVTFNLFVQNYITTSIRFWPDYKRRRWSKIIFHTKIANLLFDNMKLKIIMLRISSTKLTFLIKSY